MTDLTDRMRTCAAYLLHNDVMIAYQPVRDAADLLIEASNALEAAPAPLGTPMDIIPPNIRSQEEFPPPPQGWSEVAGQRRINTCPRCDSRAAKRVRRQGNKLMVECPVCSHAWKYKPPGEWR